MVTVHLTVELNAGGRCLSRILADSCLPTSPRAGPNQGSTIKSTRSPSSAAYIQSWSWSSLSAIGSQRQERKVKTPTWASLLWQPGSGVQALCLQSCQRWPSTDWVSLATRGSVLSSQWPQQAASERPGPESQQHHLDSEALTTKEGSQPGYNQWLLFDEGA